jgi:hypothetical protein
LSETDLDWLEPREQAFRAALDWHLPGSGIYDKDVAVAMIDRSLLVYDDADRPLNVREAITDLLERKPHLRGVGEPGR